MPQFIRGALHMVQTRLTAAAAGLAQQAHSGQKDKGGAPYIDHVFTVANAMDTEEETCAALLHDVLEDSDFTADDMRDIGMSDTVIEAVELLTHDRSVEYFEYIRQVCGNPLAAKVKRADLEHNADLSRMARLTSIDMKRRSKYLEALRILDGDEDEQRLSGYRQSSGKDQIDMADAASHAPHAPAAPPRQV